MKLQTALIFGEHMVLQRDQVIKIFGTSVQDDEVRVELNGCSVTAKAVDGRWVAEIPPQPASWHTSLVITSTLTDEVIRFSDVAIGEVWLAGGQSNMEFIMKYDVDCQEALSLPDDDALRYFRYPHTAFTGFLEIDSMPAEGFWRKWTTRENRIEFSAVGGYMGMVLRKKLNVPVGIIGCNWGGTPAAAWSDPDMIRDNPALQPVMEWHRQGCLDTDWSKYIPASEVPPAKPTRQQQEFNDRFMMGEDMTEFFRNFDPSKLPKTDYNPFGPGPRSNVRPGGLYENMLAKLAPYSLKGAVWYQGEDDDAKDWADFYQESMKTLILSWRQLWGYDFPFYQIELAPFQGVGVTGARKYAEIRHKQSEAASQLPDVHEICILDAGEQFNIHPRRKKMVGNRLAGSVMKHTYGDDSLVADCPVAVSAERIDDQIIIRFSNSAEGMVINGDLNAVLKLNGKEATDCQAYAGGDRLIIKGKLESEKITVEYCETNWCVAALFNSEGNPAFGFRYEV